MRYLNIVLSNIFYLSFYKQLDVQVYYKRKQAVSSRHGNVRYVYYHYCKVRANLNLSVMGLFRDKRIIRQMRS